jgi:hypothetical protein
VRRRGPGVAVRFATEAGRRIGERGADPGNHRREVVPPSKLPVEE